MKVLIDTCVMFDIIDQNRERAPLGNELNKFLVSNEIGIVLLIIFNLISGFKESHHMPGAPYILLISRRSKIHV